MFHFGEEASLFGGKARAEDEISGGGGGSLMRFILGRKLPCLAAKTVRRMRSVVVMVR